MENSQDDFEARVLRTLRVPDNRFPVLAPISRKQTQKLGTIDP